MKKYFLPCFLFLVFSSSSYAQNSINADSGVFLLHKFEQHIGKETYHISSSNGITTYSIDFKFVDRLTPVPLKTELKVTTQLEPLSLTIKGNTSRVSTINDKIDIKNKVAYIKVDDSSFNKKLLSISFPIAGYSPGTVQQVLLQYWKKHRQPANITTLPFGSVQIKKGGVDKLTHNGKPLILDRYVISGLIWGNELLWTDSKGQLICLITNDAEGDKLEMMNEPYEKLLPELLSKAAVYGMQLFSKSTKTPAAVVEKTTVLEGGTVIDVVNKTSIPDAVVIMEDGLIKRVGKAGSVPIPANAKVINVKGKVIMPGLWDMHSHFEQAEWGPAYLAAGVTTVRDCGNEFGYINAIQKAIDSGQGIGPKILKAGIIDGVGPMALGIVQANTKEEAIKQVRRYKENGFDQIKIYSSVKPAIVKAICDESHRLGLTVTGHIPQGMTLQQGVDSGMNMVNHIEYVYAIMKRNKDHSVDFQDSTSKAALQFIKQHQVVIDPTLGVFEMVFRSVKDDITKMEPAFYSLPLPLQALFKNTGMTPEQAAKYIPLMQSLKKLVKQLYDDGVPIVAGTDMGFPGYSLDRELELYVEAGLTPAEAIQTATIIPARVMNLDKSTASIDEGKQADIIVIDGDPLNNIRDMRKVSMVFKKGEIYDPLKLHRLVGFKQ